jgi:hypothetical protein
MKLLIEWKYPLYSDSIINLTYIAISINDHKYIQLNIAFYHYVWLVDFKLRTLILYFPSLLGHDAADFLPFAILCDRLFPFNGTFPGCNAISP